LKLDITCEDLIRDFGNTPVVDKKGKEASKGFFHVYRYDTLGQYNEWRTYCLKELMKSRELKDVDEEIIHDFEWIDVFWGLPTLHLLTAEKEGRLF